MNFYQNLGRNSAVIGYEIAPDHIIVFFKGGAKYLYDYAHTGVPQVESMKALAKGGRGLGSFINTQVRKKYAAKLA